MSDQYGDVNTGTPPPVGDRSTTPGGYYGAPQPPYGQQGYTDPYAQQQATNGLSDNAAGALAYVTIIPAIIFLVMAPYNQKPFVKFHAFQQIGLTVVAIVLMFFNIIPILGQIIWLLGNLCLLVLWVICVVKASQGGAFKLPGIGNF